MVRLNSFYLPPSNWDEQAADHGGTWTLDGNEARHLSQVLRTPPGARVRLFDGRGREGLFRLARADRKRVLLEPEDLPPAQPRPPGATLALGFGRASGKGSQDRRGWLLEKAVELGAAKLVFFSAERSQGKVPDAPKPVWQDRLIAAAKQCGAPWLPELAVRPDLTGVLRDAQSCSTRILLWEDASHSDAPACGELTGSPFIVVGPEGGLSQAEARTCLDAGFAARSLGPGVLRWETAALYALTLAHHARQRELLPS